MNFKYFQACNQIEIACRVERNALLLREDAERVMKTALAWTATTKFTDMMEAVFGTDENEEEIPEIKPTPAEEEEDIPQSMFITKAEADQEETAPEEEGASTSKATKRPASKAKGPGGKKSKHKTAAPSRSGPFPIRDATAVYPKKSDEERGYLHTGVPTKFVNERYSGPFAKASIYACNYARCKREEGLTPAECDVLTQNKGQCSTHVRQHHLNICVACYVCGKRWWSAGTWMEHMKNGHSDIPKAVRFMSDEGAPGELVIKKDYVPADDEEVEVIWADDE